MFSVRKGYTMNYFSHSDIHPYCSYQAANLNFSTHQHEQIEISYVLSGTLICQTISPHQLSPGELVLVFPYQPHTFSCSKENLVFTMLFDIDFIPDFKRYFCEYDLPEPIISAKKLAPASRHALEWLRTYVQPDASVSSETALLKERGWLTVLLGDIFDKCDLIKRTETLEPELIRQLLAYMRQNITQELTAESVSRELGISSHYLSRSIRQQLHVSFHMLLTSVKLNYAEKLLRTTNLPLTVIASESGFPNTQTLTRNYRQSTGLTPAEFRKQLHAGN